MAERIQKVSIVLEVKTTERTLRHRLDYADGEPLAETLVAVHEAFRNLNGRGEHGWEVV